MNETPDIETSSAAYRQRFNGAVGQWLLSVQAESIFYFLTDSQSTSSRVLEVGGGHGQLTEEFLKHGFEVWVQGSSQTAFDGIAHLLEQYPERLHIVTSSIYELPFESSYFDVVVSVRVLAHIKDPSRLLAEWIRVSRNRVIFDYPPLESFNVFYPALFRIKKIIEKNTRTFEIYRSPIMAGHLKSQGCKVKGLRKQFFLPMVFHRMLKNVKVSSCLEALCRKIGLTALAGSPAVICAEKE